MRRRIGLSAGIVLLGLAFVFSQEAVEVEEKPPEIAALQKERLALLEKRYDQISSFAEVGLIDQAATIQPHLDLLLAKLDYESDVTERRRLYDLMIGEYDRLIELAKHEVNAPLRSTPPGQRDTPAIGGSNVLWLQSEKLRVQIERDRL